ncbi:MAG: hypothetical protein OEV06_03945 [Anaerolineae bacterium]|nr:hypothetical protein [Anaerolineae bacterium]
MLLQQAKKKVGPLTENCPKAVNKAKGERRRAKRNNAINLHKEAELLLTRQQFGDVWHSKGLYAIKLLGKAQLLQINGVINLCGC